jgi:hypothetical protein
MLTSVYDEADAAWKAAYCSGPDAPPSKMFGVGFRAAVDAVIEECARVAGNVRGGYSANIRTSTYEQEFSKDPDGPWVLNSDVANAILALKTTKPSDARKEAK